MKELSLMAGLVLVATSVYANDQNLASNLEVHMDTDASVIVILSIPNTTMTLVNASAFAFGDNTDNVTFSWDSNGDNVFDDAKGSFVNFDYTINGAAEAFDDKSNLPKLSVKATATDGTTATISRVPFNLCIERRDYYLERYNICMSTDSRGHDYCVAWMGCWGTVSGNIKYPFH
ncbi:hypothetical protein [Spartinivicinus ruber]|uniref:hypothetical protein n=1 Tax=Spartinivicinus ruber TaxID=2683272 RepID=UPI0013D812F9|nr:hypothetical protein [Spartinivicinus ruber]